MVTKDKSPQKPRKTSSKMVNANQHQVDRHQLDIENSNNMYIQRIHHIPSTDAHTNLSSTRTSDDLDSNILKNIEE